jgi:hypothetical protein
MAHVVDDGIDERTSIVIAELRRVAVMVDQLWRDALDAGLSDTEIPLGDASQAVHRAVITLGWQSAAEGAAHTFAVEWE